MMTLTRFHVTNFRSVDDSGWIETDDVTALVGTNEAGKTNILLPLWKLNPAKEGAIVPTADYPRKSYSSFRDTTPQPVFIRAVFEADDALAAQLANATGQAVEDVRTIEVARSYDGELEVDFPRAEPVTSVPQARVLSVLQDCVGDLAGMTPLKTEIAIRKKLEFSIQAAIDLVSSWSVPTPTTMRFSCWTSLGFPCTRWHNATCRSSSKVWRRITNYCMPPTRPSWSTLIGLNVHVRCILTIVARARLRRTYEKGMLGKAARRTPSLLRLV